MSGPPPPEYSVWAGMKQRCFNPKAPSYRYYGGRGITVCQRWRESFAAFVADMGPRPSPEHSIDRINNDGNYEPGNCRWTTWDVQANNRSAPKATEDSAGIPISAFTCASGHVKWAAKLAGISATSVSAWLHGHRKVKPDVGKILRAAAFRLAETDGACAPRTDKERKQYLRDGVLPYSVAREAIKGDRKAAHRIARRIGFMKYVTPQRVRAVLDGTKYEGFIASYIREDAQRVLGAKYGKPIVQMICRAEAERILGGR